MGNCAGSSCDATCQSSCGGCGGGCEGCSAFCENGCGSSCEGTCSGDCEGGCRNKCDSGCSGTCKTACNTACTASNAAAIIANLGINIVAGQYVRPTDMINVKNAIINEFRRRDNTAYNNNYTVVPTVGGAVLLEHGQKILEDVYAMDNSKDWRSDFKLGSAASLRPAIEYIKTLMNTVVPRT